MKHDLTIADLCTDDVSLYVFEKIAELKHYKVLFEIQKAKYISIIPATQLLLADKSFSNKAVQFANKLSNYKEIMKILIDNWEDYENKGLDMPTREADFYIETEYMKIWFFIKEKIELVFENNTRYFLCRLLEDDFTNELLWNDGDGWQTYTNNGDDTMSKVANAYSNFLVERELLSE